MRPQAELHQRFCFRQAGWSESVLDLILAHCLLRRGVPPAGGVFVQITCRDQRLLDLFNPLRLYFMGQVGVMVVEIIASAVMPNLRIPYDAAPSVYYPARVVRSSFLPPHQPHARNEQNSDRKNRRPSNPKPAS